VIKKTASRPAASQKKILTPNIRIPLQTDMPVLLPPLTTADCQQ
jgi:hypothetical protein